MTRSTEEVFISHREAVEALDLEKLAGDYADDAILVTLDRAYVGREEIKTGFFQTILAQFPDVKISFDEVAFEDNLCLLKWSAEASAVKVPFATTVFIIEDGLIQRQGEWFQMVLREG